MSWLDTVVAKAKEAGSETKQVLGQVLQGAVATTTANSELPDRIGDGIPIPKFMQGNSGQTEYRPAIIDTAAGLPALIKTLITGDKNPDSWNNQELRRSSIASERTNDQLGIKAPRNIAELALNVGGSMALPGPKIAAVQKMTGVGGKVARVATEAALPLRNGSFGTAAAVGTSIAGAINEGIDAVAPSDNYNGVMDALGNKKPKPNTILTPDAAYIRDAQDPKNALILSPDDEYMRMIDNEEAQKKADEANYQNKNLALEVGLGVALVAGAAFAGYKKYTAGPSPIIAGGTTNLVGTKFRDSVTGSGTGLFSKVPDAIFKKGVDAKTALIDGTTPIRQAVNDFMSPQQAQRLNWLLDTTSNGSSQARAMNVIKTGKSAVVNTNKRYQSIAPVIDAFYTELAPDEQNFVHSAMLASSAMDDFKRSGVWSAFSKDASGKPFDQFDAHQLINAAAVPKYDKYIKAFQQSGRDVLDMLVDGGLITDRNRQRILRESPNYVPFARALIEDAEVGSPQQFDANRVLNDARAIGVNQSVQGGAVRPPVPSIIDRWATATHAVELNRIRKEVLEAGALPGGGQKYGIYEHTGPNPPTGDNIHTVFDNGVARTFRVTDPALSRALHFYPRAGNAILEGVRNMSSNMITGPLGTLGNLFAFVKGPLYDAQMGQLLRPAGTNIGLLGEVAHRMSGGTLNLGGLDPTAIPHMLVGAARYHVDGIIGDLGKHLESAMFQNDSTLATILKGTGAQNLGKWFSNAYANSVRAQLDETGAASHVLYGNPDPQTAMVGGNKISPRFATEEARYVYDEAIRNGRPVVEQAVAKTKYELVKARQNFFVDQYLAAIESMHNGFKYSVMTANNKGNKSMEELGSLVRNISVDASKHGDSKAAEVMGYFNYANIGVQSLHRVAELVAKDPARFAMNSASVLLPLIAWKYAGLAADPDAMTAHLNQSPEQRVRNITGPAGLQIPVEPSQIFATSVIFPLLDELSGANDGKIDPSFLDAMHNFMEDPRSQHDVSRAMWGGLGEAARANDPIGVTTGLSNFPLAGPVLATQGIDPASTRFGGDAGLVKTQQQTGFDAELDKPDALVTAKHKNLITSLFGAIGSTALEVADTYHRATIQPSKQAGRTPADLALDTFRDKITASQPAFRELWGDKSKNTSIADANFEELGAKRSGYEMALNIFNTDIRAAGLTGIDPKHSLELFDDRTIKPQYAGTPAATVGAVAIGLSKELSNWKKDEQALRDQANAVRFGYSNTGQEKRLSLEQINAARSHNTLMQLELTRRAEMQVRAAIGNPDFVWEDYNPDKMTGAASQ